MEWNGIVFGMLMKRYKDKQTFVIFNNPADAIDIRSFSWSGISCSFSSLNHLRRRVSVCVETQSTRSYNAMRCDAKE